MEDEQEDPPRIDIMLTHLRRAGYFDRAAAVVAGTFTNSRTTTKRIQPVLDDRLGDLGVPVITGANLGHGGHVQTWPDRRARPARRRRPHRHSARAAPSLNPPTGR